MVQLYRTISKELPRVLTIYDADLAPAEVCVLHEAVFKLPCHFSLIRTVLREIG